MKRILRILLPLTIVAAALTACGPDKPENNPEIEKYVAAHPYVAALGDDADVLVKFHPIAIFNKTGFATDSEFQELRDMLFSDIDGMAGMMVQNVMNDFTVLGLDPANPIYLSVSNLEYEASPYVDIYYGPSVKADVYGVVPLTSRDKLMSYLKMAGVELIADENGNYLVSTDQAGALITEQAIIGYAALNRNIKEADVKESLLAAAKKTTVINLKPGADDFFTRPDDISLWADNESFAAMMELGADQWLEDAGDMDLQTLLGGDLTSGTAALLSFVSEPGALVARGETFGTNALADRFRSWIGEPRREMLSYLPTNAQAAFTFSFQNLSDALTYAQEVLERSGEAEGVNLPAVLGAFGVQPEDLNGIGTMVAAVEIGDGTIDWIAAIELGDKLLSTAEMGLAFTELAEDPDAPGVYLAGDDIAVRLVDGIAFAGSSHLIGKIGPGGLAGENFLRRNALANHLGFLAVTLDDPMLYAPFEDRNVTLIGEAIGKRFSVLKLAKEPKGNACALKLLAKEGMQGVKALVLTLAEMWNEFDSASIPPLFPVINEDGEEMEEDDFDYDYLY